MHKHLEKYFQWYIKMSIIAAGIVFLLQAFVLSAPWKLLHASPWVTIILSGIGTTILYYGIIWVLKSLYEHALWHREKNEVIRGIWVHVLQHMDKSSSTHEPTELRVGITHITQSVWKCTLDARQRHLSVQEGIIKKSMRSTRWSSKHRDINLGSSHLTIFYEATHHTHDPDHHYKEHKTIGVMLVDLPESNIFHPTQMEGHFYDLELDKLRSRSGRVEWQKCDGTMASICKQNEEYWKDLYDRFKNKFNENDYPNFTASNFRLCIEQVLLDYKGTHNS